MGAKDTKAKEFLSDNFRFADLCNFYLFQGEPVIQAENLERDAVTTINMFIKLKIEMETEEAEMDVRDAWEDHRNRGIEEGRKAGIEEGEYMKLIDIVWKKIKKGYSAEAISDLLEEDLTLIQKIFDVINYISTKPEES